MKFTAILFTIALSGHAFLLNAQTVWPEDLILTPEKSNFVKTSTYADVMRFIESIKGKTSLAHVISMGKSHEGKDIPVVILSNPPVRTAEEAKASGKLVIYIQGNIHAGEVEGKEARGCHRRFNKVELGAGSDRLSIGRTGRVGNVTLTRLCALQTNRGIHRDGHDEIINLRGP